MIAYQFLSVSAILIFSSSAFYKDVMIPLAQLGRSVIHGAALNYGVGLRHFIPFISVPVLLSLITDRRILWSMFVGERTSKSRAPRWELMIYVNWIASVIFTLSAVHLLAMEGFSDVRQSILQNKNDNRIAFILGFVSLTYLVGFFAVTLVLDVGRSHEEPDSSSINAAVDPANGIKVAGTITSSSSGLTSFVPPAYYLGVVALVWNTNDSLVERSIVSCMAIVFFATLHLCHKVKQARLKKQMEESKKSSSVSSSSTTSSSTPVEAFIASEDNIFRRYKIAKSVMSRHQIRQIFYDLFVYCIPMAGVGIFLPILQPLLHILSILLTFFTHVYNQIAARYFLLPTPKENPLHAASRLESYPMGSTFPNGWFRVSTVDELPVGEVKYITICGRHLALFRGEDSEVKCIDAHCPHLGANMAIGGQVVGNCLRCPFHGWTFDGKGQCKSIPYQPNVPAQAKTRSYHVVEYYEIILVWIHALDKVPDYYPPTHPKLENGDMLYGGSVDTEVNMHIQEFAENSTDFMHFDPLHGRMTLPYTLMTIPGIQINHKPGWKAGSGDEKHMSWFFDNADLSFFGIHVPETAASAVITFVGPASVVFFTFNTPIGNIILFQTHTPLEPLRLKTCFRWYADATMPRLLSWYIVGNWIAQWQNDIFVWENKIFARKPLLVRGDGPMQKQRAWYKQFYSVSNCDANVADIEDLVPEDKDKAKS